MLDTATQGGLPQALMLICALVTAAGIAAQFVQAKVDLTPLILGLFVTMFLLGALASLLSVLTALTGAWQQDAASAQDAIARGVSGALFSAAWTLMAGIPLVIAGGIALVRRRLRAVQG